MITKYTVLTDTLCDGPIVAWLEQDNAPVLWDTREAAEQELAEDRADATAEVARGEREEGDDPFEEDWVVEVQVTDDGSLTIPELGVTWTPADIRAQHGIEEAE